MAKGNIEDVVMDKPRVDIALDEAGKFVWLKQEFGPRVVVAIAEIVKVRTIILAPAHVIAEVLDRCDGTVTVEHEGAVGQDHDQASIWPEDATPLFEHPDRVRHMLEHMRGEDSSVCPGSHTSQIARLCHDYLARREPRVSTVSFAGLGPDRGLGEVDEIKMGENVVYGGNPSRTEYVARPSDLQGGRSRQVAP